MVAMYDVDVHVELGTLGPVVQLSELESRLARGYEMIDEYREAGLAVSKLEEHWLKLLADYELLYNRQN
ncbi:MAG: hypothetical protein H0V47_07010 [Chloroflexia bacterium]|nr:hypothetical protein [Chloroflexia bacterium]